MSELSRNNNNEVHEKITFLNNNNNNNNAASIADLKNIDIIQSIQNEINNNTQNNAQKSDKDRLALQESYQVWNIWNWVYSNAIDTVESKMFECLKNKVERRYVYINNRSQRIWTAFSNIDSQNTPVVLIHGFGGGIGLFLPMLDTLSESHPLYAFDLLGFGRSSRSNFSTDAVEAENEFIQSIEHWRQEVGLDKMILLGHSFGGFLCSAYALKYPQHTKALILADPWGFSERDVNRRYSFIRRILIKCSEYISPLSIFRVTGYFSVNLLRRLRPEFSRKYANILGENDLIYEYIYHSNRQVPSGELGFRVISDQVVKYAKYPMVKRIEKLNADIPIWFIYGEDTWIGKEAGLLVKELRKDYAFVSVTMFPDAGHHVYADQPEMFNKKLKEILRSIDGLPALNSDSEDTSVQEQNQTNDDYI